jgi:hypothetical protein
MAGVHLNSPIVGIALTPDADGYWLVAADGGVFTFGSARFFGSMGATPLNQPIVGMAAAPDGQGYWLVAADGGVFAFGSATFHGSLSGAHILAPVVAIAPSLAGDGYYLLTASGELFGEVGAASGGAVAVDLPARAARYVGLTALAGGSGVEAVTAQGDTAFAGAGSSGQAQGCGYTLPFSPIAPVVGIAGGASNLCDTTILNGWLAASDGGVFTSRGNYLGSMSGTTLVAPIVGIAGTRA